MNTLKSYDPSNGDLLGELPVSEKEQITKTLSQAKIAGKKLAATEHK